MHIPNDIKMRLRAVPLEQIIKDILAQKGITEPRQTSLTPAGTDKKKMCCPFHPEKTASFVIFEDGNRYECFGAGCGKKGDAFDFVMQMLPQAGSFPGAMAYIAHAYFPDDHEILSYFKEGVPSKKKRSKLHFDLTFPSQDLLTVVAKAQEYYRNELTTNKGHKAEAARKYLAERRISAGLIERLGIGYAPDNDVLLMHLMEALGQTSESFELLRQAGIVNDDGYATIRNRLTFPLATRSNVPLGFMGRAIGSHKMPQKYKNTPQCTIFSKGHMLFGLNYLREEDVQKHGLYIVEGMTDLCGFLEQDMQCAVVLGCAALTEGHCSIIGELKPPRIFMLTDGDIPGIKAAVRNVNRLIGTYEWNWVDLKKDAGWAQENITIIGMPSDKDPFDVFYTASQPIADYTKRYAQPPKTFLLDNLTMIRNASDTQESFNGFIAESTNHILTPQELDKLGIQAKQVNSQYYFQPVPTFLPDKA